MSRKKNQPAPQSESDKATLEALEKGYPLPPTVENTEGLEKGEGTEELGKGEDAPKNKNDGAEQDKANGGQQAPVTKGDGKKKDEDEEEEEEEEEKEKGFTSDELRKSLEKAIAIAEGSDLDVTARRAELGEKLSKGELTDDERDELKRYLADPLADEPTDDDPVQKSYAEMAVDDPDLESPSDEIDASGFLQRFAAFNGGALDEIRGDMVKGFRRLNSFNVELAKSFIEMQKGQIERDKLISKQNELVKSLSERLEKVENTPVGRRAASTVGQAKHLERSFGNDDEGNRITHTEMIKGLSKLSRESKDGKDPTGQYDLTWFTAQAESGYGIPDGLMDEVRKSLRK